MDDGLWTSDERLIRGSREREFFVVRGFGLQSIVRGSSCRSVRCVARRGIVRADRGRVEEERQHGGGTETDERGQKEEALEVGDAVVREGLLDEPRTNRVREQCAAA